MDAAPVGGIGDAGVEAGETVLPPRYTGLVEEGDACHERTRVAVAAIGLLEVAPLAEASVAQAEYAFGHAEVVGMKLVFNDIPLVGLQISSHGDSLCIRVTP